MEKILYKTASTKLGTLFEKKKDTQLIITVLDK